MTEALRHAVQNLLKDQEQQMNKISALEGIGPLLFMYSIQIFKLKPGFVNAELCSPTVLRIVFGCEA